MDKQESGCAWFVDGLCQKATEHQSLCSSCSDTDELGRGRADVATVEDNRFILRLGVVGRTRLTQFLMREGVAAVNEKVASTPKSEEERPYQQLLATQRSKLVRNGKMGLLR